ncbi:MAG: nucleotidyl transferase AbiEii/AbiGii toxin family protein [Crocinitomicaceae bacterium]|nr:nucleotidyl transferase AbiEii/AbiGii toxin family protein [Crocinitomicaceae bacterium]
MASKLFYNTVSPLLLECLNLLMKAKEFKKLRLVGGTALSLHIGHRESVDIDMFTDESYGSIDFGTIDSFLKATFPHVDTNDYSVVGNGKSYYIGNSQEDNIKLDVFYTNESFFQKAEMIDGIRMASIEEIVAMKVDVISRGGRKKDFWDLHELLVNEFPIEKMVAVHKQRHPYTHDRKLIAEKFSDFTGADNDYDPVCLKGKHWELIKLDIVDFSDELVQRK